MPDSQSGVRRGLFFSFEGVDGSGKSTQARLLANALEQMDGRVVRVREPGGTPIGEQIRTLLLDPAARITDRAEALLFAAARAQLVEEIIDPALSSGIHVIADRYVDSTSAYQGGGRHLGSAVDRVSAFATNGRMPDRTYLVSLPLDEAAERRSYRDADRMEQPSDDFRERIAETYDRLTTAHQDRIVSVDGRLSVQTLHDIIRQDALALIKKAVTG